MNDPAPPPDQEQNPFWTSDPMRLRVSAINEEYYRNNFDVSMSHTSSLGIELGDSITQSPAAKIDWRKHYLYKQDGTTSHIIPNKADYFGRRTSASMTQTFNSDAKTIHTVHYKVTINFPDTAPRYSNMSKSTGAFC